MNWIKNNWKLKLLSLVGAIFLWSFVISIENPTVTTEIHNIPIVYENENALNDKNLVLLTEQRPYINLSIKGPRNKIVNITTQHIRVSTDLSKYKEGLNSLKLTYDLPEGVEVVAEPELINIDIQKIITKNFHVEIDLQGTMKPDYILESKKSTPEQISVKGPRVFVESIDSLKAKLDASKLDKDIVTNVNIEALTKDGKVVDNIILGQNFVNINATVNKSKEVPINTATENELSEGLKLLGKTVEPKSIFVKGDAEVIDKIESIQSTKIDLSKIFRTTTLPVELNLPTGISLVDNSTKVTARIDVEKKVEKTIDIPVGKIEITGNASGKKPVFDKETFSVRIRGFDQAITEIKPEDFTVTYDLKNEQVTETRITPEVKSEGDFEIEYVENIRVKFE